MHGRNKLRCGIAAVVLIPLGMVVSDSPADADEGDVPARTSTSHWFKLTKFDTSGDDSELKNCEKGKVKFFNFDVRLKPSARGKFVNIGKSFARLTLSDGKVVETTGVIVNESRRALAFKLYSTESSRKVTVNRSALNYVTMQTTPSVKTTDIVRYDIGTFCVTVPGV